MDDDDMLRAERLAQKLVAQKEREAEEQRQREEAQRQAREKEEGK